MDTQMVLTFIILAVTILLYISDRLPVDIVAILSLLALTLTGIITADQALAGFANQTVITIAALYDRSRSVTIQFGRPYRFITRFRNFSAALRSRRFLA